MTLSYYLYFFSFSYQWMHKSKVTYKEVQDDIVGLGLLLIYIYGVQNLMETPLSSSCQLR